MKKQSYFLIKALAIVMIVSSSYTMIAQVTKVVFDDNWGNQGISLVSQENTGLVLNSSVEAFDYIVTDVNNKECMTVSTEGVLLQNQEGAPNLPTFSSYIAIPQGAKVIAKIRNKQTETSSDVTIAPSPVIPLDNEKGPLVFKYNNKIYSKDALYPENIVNVSKPSKIRGLDVVLIAINPFQYNPVTKELLIHKDIEIEISYQGGTNIFGEDRLRNRWWDPILSDAVINPEVIGEYSPSSRSSRTTGCEYLIITPDDPVFISWADSLKIFRNQQGILTDIITTTEIGGNTVSAIESFIDDAYNTWDIPPAAVLLLGDYGTSGSTIISPIYNNYCASDNIFADVDNDHMPDIIFARMTAQTEDHLETYITKVLNYEKAPPTNPDFYNHPITALGWQTERWFQICSETVGGFFKNVHGKNPVRINEVYDGNPDVDPWSTAPNTTTVLNYFGPNGLGYLPSTPGELGDWEGGSAADVNNALNDGAFILQHRDHGGENGWGEPNYNNSSINGLTNTDLSFIFSINCLTGKYNAPSECFTEKFHRYKYNGENAGALGLIAASEVSYSFVNDTYVWGLFDNMWPEFMPDYGSTPEPRGILPAFGNAAGKYFLQQSSWPYNTGNKEVTYNLFHHHGDAFSVVYSEVPQYLTVVHDQGIVAGSTGFEIEADEGSLIALTVNNTIIGTANGTGEPMIIDIEAQYPPSEILVTITKQNYYRYSEIVEVIPPEGAYVIYNDVTINNSNGLMTTGETTLAEIVLKNIGVEEGENINVTLETSDEYIEIVDSQEDYGNIAPGATSSVVDGFSWNVANNIPDLHLVNFNVETTDGTDTWVSKMKVFAHAPNLSVDNFEFDDSQLGNNNGLLDAGETVELIIETTNNGSSNAPSSQSVLACYSAYVNVVNEEFSIGDIPPGNTEYSSFTIEISENTPVGSIIEFEVNSTSGEYTAEKAFNQKVGLVVEDWETGDMTKYAWTTGGNSPWELTTNNIYEGTYSIKSGSIGHQQSTWISIIHESAMDDSISFYVQVSSENGYDFFRFYIDGIERIKLSGEQDWQKISVPVEAGIHFYTWQYNKDVNTTSGEDCAYVDFIILPTPIITTVFAGNDMIFCESEDMQCEGTSSNCESVLWETSGSGSFTDPEDHSPIYIPSEEDVIEGMVELTFTGHGPVEDVSDVVVFTIENTPEVEAGESVTVCESETITIDNATAEYYSTLTWTTSGDGLFNDNSIVNASYTPGINDIENGVITLTLMAINGEACGEISDDLELTIEKAPSAFAGIDADICPSTTYTIVDAEVINYSSITWETSGDGEFDDNSISNPTYTPGDNDKENKEVILSVRADNDNGCEEVTDEMLLTLLCTSIGEVDDYAAIKLFPNPNDGNFSLEISGIDNELVNITIINSLGVVLYNESNIELSENFSKVFNLLSKPGIYSISVSNTDLNINKKFIVK